MAEFLGERNWVTTAPRGEPPVNKTYQEHAGILQSLCLMHRQDIDGIPFAFGLPFRGVVAGFDEGIEIVDEPGNAIIASDAGEPLDDREKLGHVLDPSRVFRIRRIRDRLQQSGCLLQIGIKDGPCRLVRREVEHRCNVLDEPVGGCCIVGAESQLAEASLDCQMKDVVKTPVAASGECGELSKDLRVEFVRRRRCNMVERRRVGGVGKHA